MPCRPVGQKLLLSFQDRSAEVAGQRRAKPRHVAVGLGHGAKRVCRCTRAKVGLVVAIRDRSEHRRLQRDACNADERDDPDRGDPDDDFPLEPDRAERRCPDDQRLGIIPNVAGRLNIRSKTWSIAALSD